MAHEVYQIGEDDSMAYAGVEVPWHGLGQNIPDDQPIDVWAKTAHMDWNVNRAPVVYNAEGETYYEHASQHVLFRSDNFNPLGIVSNIYKIVQPIEVLEFYRDLVEKNGYKMETAGSLRGGALVWALAKVPMEMRLMGQDRVLSYLLLGTSYDKTMSTSAMFTSVRVVCANTMSTAYNVHGGRVNISHLSTFDADKVKIDLGATKESWEKFEEQSNKMAETKLTKEQAVKYFMDLYHSPKNGDDYSDVNKTAVSVLLDLFEKGPGSNLKSASSTLWGALNAVTRFVDHEKGAQSKANRLNSAWFGDGALLKRKAWISADTYGMAKAA
jgi:phage/plasmid-like protein (TIGR03299 family)